MKSSSLALLTLATIALVAQLSALKARAAEISTTEQQIVDRVDNNTAAALALLEKTVNINSGTMNFEGVREVGKVFSEEFDALGFQTNWVDGQPFGRAGHLLASYNSQSNGPKILLIGHLDTVFEKSESFQEFKRLSDGKVAGPGITDMKGGNVIIISALGALRELGLLNQLNIKVVFTGDEESSGSPLSTARKTLVDAAEWADIALGFEDGDGDIGTAVIARRGSVDWELNVVGRAAHSSQIFKPEVGYGAIFETARILNEFREQLAGVGNLTFNPGMIVGGTSLSHSPETASADAFGKNNVVAKTVKVTGGIRALTPSELDNAKQVMAKIVSESLPHTSAELSFGEGYPPMAPTEGNRSLLKIYSEISESLGYGSVKAVNPRNAGAADISFTAQYINMGLDGLGLMGTGGHTVDEIADIDSLTKNSHKAALLLYRLSKTD